jgi:DNA-binding NtrC family response regulator
VRLIAATNKDLEKAMREGSFRQDLYYRLQVVTISLPPLRERKEDIPELVSYFLKKFGPQINPKVTEISAEALEKLMRYSWPGNVRELENAIKRGLILARGSALLSEDFPLEDTQTVDLQRQMDLEEKLELLIEPVFKELKELARSSGQIDFISTVEKMLIKKALQETKGNQVQAATLLGINRNTLRSKMERYKIRKDVTIAEDE